MSLITIYGINGIGKDTVANALKNSVTQNIYITSTPRLLMYAFGITKTFYTNEKIQKEQYQMLESIDQSEIDKIDNTYCRELLEEFAASNSRYFILISHLVPALNLYSEETSYLTDRKIQDWYIDLNRCLVQLVAPAEIVLKRREEDLRFRSRPVSIDQIKYHQNLCDVEWARIIDSINNNNLNCVAESIPNIELIDTVEDVKRLLLYRKY